MDKIGASALWKYHSFVCLQPRALTEKADVWFPFCRKGSAFSLWRLSEFSWSLMFLTFNGVHPVSFSIPRWSCHPVVSKVFVQSWEIFGSYFSRNSSSPVYPFPEGCYEEMSAAILHCSYPTFVHSISSSIPIASWDSFFPPLVSLIIHLSHTPILLSNPSATFCIASYFFHPWSLPWFFPVTDSFCFIILPYFVVDSYLFPILLFYSTVSASSGTGGSFSVLESSDVLLFSCSSSLTPWMVSSLS